MNEHAHVVAISVDAAWAARRVRHDADLVAPVATIGVALASVMHDGSSAILAFEGSRRYTSKIDAPGSARTERDRLRDFAEQIGQLDAPIILTLGGARRDLERLRNRCALFCIACAPLADDRLVGRPPAINIHLEMARLVGGVGVGGTKAAEDFLTTLVGRLDRDGKHEPFGEEEAAIWMLLGFARLLGVSGRAEFETVFRFEQKLRAWIDELASHP